MKQYVAYLVAGTFLATNSLAASLADTMPESGGWTRISENVYQKINAENGSVSTRLFGAEASSFRERQLKEQVDFLFSKAMSGAATGDDQSELASAQQELAESHFDKTSNVNLPSSVHPDSVTDSGTQCDLNFSFDHISRMGGVGSESQQVTSSSQATPTAHGLIVISFATHRDSVTVTPSATAMNQTGSSANVTQQQPTIAPFGTVVTASTIWNDPGDFQSPTLCTASASSSIHVKYADASTCDIAQTTNYPDCASHL